MQPSPYDDPAVRSIVCVAFPAWKRHYVPPFMGARGRRIVHAKTLKAAAREVREGSAILVWGMAFEGPALDRFSSEHGVPVWRMEDGFLRSAGLGSDLHAPASLVVDTAGIYFDPRTPSDLELILAETSFEPAELERARKLREAIVEARVSKYNVGSRRRVGPARAVRSLALVVGQVEDDMSIQCGCLDVRLNEALLRAARVARPHSFLLYKPHPDVVSGNRRDSLPLSLAARLCDEVVVDASLADCLESVDEVHTMTSLVGFEALLRGRSVHTYGQPFYSGWGLTVDRHTHARRTRRLSLDELVAGTLIRYPRYVDPVSGRPSTAEDTVRLLASATGGAPLRRSNRLRRLLRRARNVVRGAIRGA